MDPQLRGFIMPRPFSSASERLAEGAVTTSTHGRVFGFASQAHVSFELDASLVVGSRDDPRTAGRAATNSVPEVVKFLQNLYKHFAVVRSLRHLRLNPGRTVQHSFSSCGIPSWLGCGREKREGPAGSQEGHAVVHMSGDWPEGPLLFRCSLRSAKTWIAGAWRAQLPCKQQTRPFSL